MNEYFDKLLDMNVLYESFQKCKSGVDWKASVQRYESNLLYNLNSLRKRLEDGTYIPDKFTEFTVHERGKTRNIKSPSLTDRVLQRAICDEVLEPILYPKLIYDNGASVKDKGVEFSRRRLYKKLATFYRENGNDGYILISDFTKFFDSIPHDKMIESLAKEIKDKRVLEILELTIKSFSPSGKGLGIGSQISQICGVYYPTPLDVYFTSVKGCKYYARHMDDFYIISKEKEELKQLLEDAKHIAHELGLQISEKKTHICRINKGFTFLKQYIYVSDSGKIVIRPDKRNIVRERRKLKSFRRKLDKSEITFDCIARQYKTWRGSTKKYAKYSTLKSMDTLYKGLFTEEMNMSLISNSGHDENNNYSGGRPGDQTGTEWALIPWYSRPWKCVLRHPDAAVREKIAALSVKAANNNLIGYCQTHRGTYWQHLKASNYDPSQITVACEADCSAGVIANVKAAGYLLNIDALKNLKATYTGDMRTAFKAAGFTVLTDSKYLTSADYLLRGDVLLNDGLHTATNVQTGVKAVGANSASGNAGKTNNSKKSNVENGQKWLNSNYGDKIVKYCGAKLSTDGVYGDKSRWAALTVWKDLMNRRFGTKLDPANKNFFDSCKSVASKSTVKKGTTGTFTFLVEFILAAKGYYTGNMDALCGDGLVSAIKSYQKAKGLDSDGICGANTWYSLFN